MGVVEIESVQQFDDIVLNKNDQHDKKYIFVDFWAHWCMPCRMVSPALHKYSDEYNKNIYYVSVNIDKVGKLATRYNIQSIPTFKTFEVGSLETELEDFVGANKTKLEEKLRLLDEGIKLDENF